MSSGCLKPSTACISFVLFLFTILVLTLPEPWISHESETTSKWEGSLTLVTKGLEDFEEFDYHSLTTSCCILQYVSTENLSIVFPYEDMCRYFEFLSSELETLLIVSFLCAFLLFMALLILLVPGYEAKKCSSILYFIWIVVESVTAGIVLDNHVNLVFDGNCSGEFEPGMELCGEYMMELFIATIVFSASWYFLNYILIKIYSN